MANPTPEREQETPDDDDYEGPSGDWWDKLDDVGRVVWWLTLGRTWKNKACVPEAVSMKVFDAIGKLVNRVEQQIAAEKRAARTALAPQEAGGPQTSDLIAALNDAPIISKYHGHSGFDVERFVRDYNAWTLAKGVVLHFIPREEGVDATTKGPETFDQFKCGYISNTGNPHPSQPNPCDCKYCVGFRARTRSTR